jgi:photosystem II stability/assembly factor-like uncharacterized protein
MKPQNIFSNLLDVLIVLCLLLFFASFGFRDSRMSGGWYQQFFPNMNGSTITSLTFLDSIVGYATTSKNSNNQTYIIKTTNGGDNWFIIFTYIPTGVNTYLSKILFANNNTGFVSTNDAGDFFKTTNAGINWIDYQVPVVAYDFSVINADTLLHVNNTGFGPGVYISTNGALNWQGISTTQVNNIYMFNKNIGFSLGNNMWKTTNGGVNWFVIPGESYQDIKFFDTSKGWKTYGTNILEVTTNGGLNWTPQQLPNISHTFTGTNLNIVNKDTVWMVGAAYFPSAPIYKTTNGGINWSYQIPDSLYPVYIYNYINFINSKIGWSYSNTSSFEIHTKVGGNDTSFFTLVRNNKITSIPKDCILFQNYPNPFNPITNIKFQMLKHGFVEIKIFDITGKLVKVLINEKLYSGEYSAKFDAGELPSGIYFYSLYIDGLKVDTKKAILLK